MSEDQGPADSGGAAGAGPAVDVAAAGESQATAAPVRFPELRPGETPPNESPLDRVYDLTVPVSVELGTASLSVQEILHLAPGAVIELDRSADAAVELHVHGKCVATGQIVVVDGFYGVRIIKVGEGA